MHFLLHIFGHISAIWPQLIVQGSQTEYKQIKNNIKILLCGNMGKMNNEEE